MQAARGTSVAGDDERPTRDARRRRTRLLRIFACVAIGGYLFDLVTKILAVQHLTGRADVQVLGDLLRLHLTRNPGAAFSTGTAYTPVLSVIAIIACAAVLWVVRRVGSIGWAIGLGFLLAGIAGNLTDRIVRPPSPLHGHVVDFLRLPNWPIFNVADICINIAAVFILVMAFRGIRLDGSRDRDTTPGDRPDDDAPADAADHAASQDAGSKDS